MNPREFDCLTGYSALFLSYMKVIFVFMLHGPISLLCFLLFCCFVRNLRHHEDHYMIMERYPRFIDDHDEKDA